ncbi:MAG: type II toxin-antitoxin system VapC family toxin [Austwickia sp.]|nr:type II toxin-antitoxin system VapC family toxin [Austwickia sp.]
MASGDVWAVDTSVAVAALDAAHGAHAACLDVVRGERPALAGHAAFELYAVLTRMPGSLGVDPRQAAHLIERVFPEVAELDPAAAAALRTRLPVLGITGGAVYDALVAEAARTTGRRLFTRDQRARRTYDLLGIDYHLVGP